MAVPPAPHAALHTPHDDALPAATNHRPVTSCTHCRQQKIRCNALQKQPQPCTRCAKLNLKCNIDPNFKPKKGSQLKSLKDEIDHLKRALKAKTDLLDSAGVITQLLHYNPDSDSKSNSTTTATNAEAACASAIFKINDFQIGFTAASELLSIFNSRFLPFLPILEPVHNPVQLYLQSKLLFWSIILVASLHSGNATNYLKLSGLVRLLINKICWLRTPRSTHISQALLILANWPLPNQKILDDSSYRYVSLSRTLSLQLGLHRGGQFISEFSRSQVKLKNPEYWRSITWKSIFFQDLLWSSILGLPPSVDLDYLILQDTKSCDDQDDINGKRFNCLLELAKFQLKLFKRLGQNKDVPDGLLLYQKRDLILKGALDEFDTLCESFQDQSHLIVKIYSSYTKLIICGFAFLPETSLNLQSKFILIAYHSSTEIVTNLTNLIKSYPLIELPIYIRQSASYASMILFKLQFSPYLSTKYFNSIRQSIVTIHRLYRNQLNDWKKLIENDISRTASLLEKLNFVLITFPEIFLENNKFIISKMRSHLTGSLFYDLVWCIHEARRRQNLKKSEKNSTNSNQNSDTENLLNSKKLFPLPLYNQITKENFENVTTTSPNGTTITKLIPTKLALDKIERELNYDTTTPVHSTISKPLESFPPVILEKNIDPDYKQIKMINGIPLSMLDETGSIDKNLYLLSANTSNSINNNDISLQTAINLNDHNNLNPFSQSNSLTNIKSPTVATEPLYNNVSPILHSTDLDNLHPFNASTLLNNQVSYTSHNQNIHGIHNHHMKNDSPLTISSYPPRYKNKNKSLFANNHGNSNSNSHHNNNNSNNKNNNGYGGIHNYQSINQNQFQNNNRVNKGNNLHNLHNNLNNLNFFNPKSYDPTTPNSLLNNIKLQSSSHINLTHTNSNPQFNNNNKNNNNSMITTTDAITNANSNNNTNLNTNTNANPNTISASESSNSNSNSNYYDSLSIPEYSSNTHPSNIMSNPTIIINNPPSLESNLLNSSNPLLNNSTNPNPQSDSNPPTDPNPNNDSNIITSNMNNPSELDIFFQQQSAGWIEAGFNSDDFLGYFDVDMNPEF
ncbi:hypothetical protein TBLA_0D00630 [Henningerozyma blattae CBS 6284]|uniref:Zn(2)-C6 fungal-type domain-containing protein n=1 Tax=Henningerozyma blattae (strain ATCC 34711 / CBS 6284 / DSM 70876 / NBRC 10599 / NRRL Y-10934 / UCD 77-7) TaxID=1071380 RepID=I2H2G8_HENB6|nr:hypothetical protein TBLA_0D00630 [Tetrapisispora blattae CBS 6284]CCH60570.1 hypothetical protein TBLA_0D00630 [Tetrapisispora blattae CBS 6284]